MGIIVDNVKLDLPVMMKTKESRVTGELFIFDDIVRRGRHHHKITLSKEKMVGIWKFDVISGLTSGIEGLFKKNKVAYAKGKGVIVGPNEVRVDMADGTTQNIKSKNIIIATGSDVAVPPSLKVSIFSVFSSFSFTSRLLLDRKSPYFVHL